MIDRYFLCATELGGHLDIGFRHPLENKLPGGLEFKKFLTEVRAWSLFRVRPNWLCLAFTQFC